jgi:alpha-beta hydrolase superfamily lysophospholipase
LSYLKYSESELNGLFAGLPQAACQPLRDTLAFDAAQVQAGQLQPACQSFFVRSPAQKACGVVLLLHGFTAGPYQFQDLAAHLGHAGLHAYAVRLPGHGARLADGKHSFLDLPKSAELNLYQAAAHRALEAAHALADATGVPLYVLGFSMGGAMATGLALQFPQKIQRLVLVAPLLRPYGNVAQAFLLCTAQLCRLGLGGFLDRVPYSWGKLDAAALDRPGHWDFRLGNLFAALSYAHSVRQHPAVLQVPTFLLVSDADTKCDVPAALQLLARSTAPTCVHRFARDMALPHNLLSRRENKNTQSIALAERLIASFLCNGTVAESH